MLSLSLYTTCSLLLLWPPAIWSHHSSGTLLQIPQLTSLFRQYSDKGFEIINISIDIKRENWLKAVKKFGLEPWKNVLASDNPSLSEKYSNIVSPIPSEILINKAGVIIWNSDGDMLLSLDKTLDLSIYGKKWVFLYTSIYFVFLILENFDSSWSDLSTIVLGFF